MRCPPVPQIINAHSLSSEETHQAIYMCTSGYLYGTDEKFNITCHNGEWETPTIFCQGFNPVLNFLTDDPIVIHCAEVIITNNISSLPLSVEFSVQLLWNTL